VPIEPGAYLDGRLEELLTEYLSEARATPSRTGYSLLRLCPTHDIVTRAIIKSELVARGEAREERQAGRLLTTISGGLGTLRRDHLRQTVRYEQVSDYEKENFRGDSQYRDVVTRVLRRAAE